MSYQQQGYPQQQQHVVVQTVVGPLPASQYAMSWGQTYNSGLCSCCDDVASCCEVYWCGYCQIGYQRFFITNGRPGMDTGSCCCACLLDAFCTCGCMYAYCAWDVRKRVAMRYFLQEQQEGCMQCLAGCCCPSCSLCQTFREMDKRGEFPGGCCVKPSPIGPAPMTMGGNQQQQPVQGQPVYAPNNNNSNNNEPVGNSGDGQYYQHQQHQQQGGHYPPPQQGGYAPQQQQQQQYGGYPQQQPQQNNNNPDSSYSNPPPPQQGGYPPQQHQNYGGSRV